MKDRDKLEINEHFGFQVFFWRLQRFAWVACIALVIYLAIQNSFEPVYRAVAVYFSLLLILRLAGRRTLGEQTNFDLILLLIISEAIQPFLTGDNPTFQNALILVLTLVGLDIFFAWLKSHFMKVEKWMEGPPLIVVENGKLLQNKLAKARLNKDDVLMAARSKGIKNLSEIRYAILEPTGALTIIPTDNVPLDKAS